KLTRAPIGVLVRVENICTVTTENLSQTGDQTATIRTRDQERGQMLFRHAGPLSQPGCRERERKHTFLRLLSLPEKEVSRLPVRSRPHPSNPPSASFR